MDRNESGPTPVCTREMHIVNWQDMQISAERARDGDRESLAEVCAGVFPEVLRYARYRVGPSDAEDLAAEVSLRVVRGIRTLKGSFVAWLYRVAGNVVKDHYAARSRRRETPLHELKEDRPGLAEQPAERAIKRMDIETTLTRLSHDHRQVVTLRFVQGLPTRDVAEIMERTPGAVRVLQFRALAALRELLGPEGGMA